MSVTNLLKKIIGILLLLFVGTGILNLLLGLMFTVWNTNKNHLGEAYIDAPYVYYQKKSSGNHSGFAIDSSVSLQKDSTEYRVVVIGGSVAYGLCMQKAANQQPSLEQQLQKHIPDKKIRVLNGALPAFVSEQEFIALQLNLRKYQPNLVIALHGFNDIESFRVNHHADGPNYIPSPIFYNGDEFSPALRAVEDYKKTYTIKGVLEGYTRYIRKAFRFITRSLGFTRYDYENYASVTADQLNRYAQAFATVVTDQQQFCAANHISYIDVLQPVRFYREKDSSYYDVTGTASTNNFLSKLYYRMEQLTATIPGHFSLTGADTSKLQFTDACHPSDSGYLWMASVLAEKTAAFLQKSD